MLQNTPFTMHYSPVQMPPPVVWQSPANPMDAWAMRRAGNAVNRAHSAKLFVGAIPSEANEWVLVDTFRPFGLDELWWPGKNEGKPVSGYAFATFRCHNDVGRLLCACDQHNGRYSFQLINLGRKVEIRPFALNDASHILDPLWSRFIRLSIFVGGIPRTVTASELASVMECKFGQVLHCSLELEYPHKYPKGAGRVVFRSLRSYKTAALARRVVLEFGEEQRSVEIKPYVYKDIPCEACNKGGRHTSFCAVCLQYYCCPCWTNAHRLANPPHHELLCSQRNLPNLGC